MEDKLSGHYFHSDAERSWQGKVLGPVSTSGNYWMVETYSWLDGRVYDERVVSIHDMTDWRFYPTREAMKRNYETVQALWDSDCKSVGG